MKKVMLLLLSLLTTSYVVTADTQQASGTTSSEGWRRNITNRLGITRPGRTIFEENLYPAVKKELAKLRKEIITDWTETDKAERLKNPKYCEYLYLTYLASIDAKESDEQSRMIKEMHSVFETITKTPDEQSIPVLERLENKYQGIKPIAIKNLKSELEQDANEDNKPALYHNSNFIRNIAAFGVGQLANYLAQESIQAGMSYAQKELHPAVIPAISVVIGGAVSCCFNEVCKNSDRQATAAYAATVEIPNQPEQTPA